MEFNLHDFNKAIQQTSIQNQINIRKEIEKEDSEFYFHLKNRLDNELKWNGHLLNDSGYNEAEERDLNGTNGLADMIEKIRTKDL